MLKNNFIRPTTVNKFAWIITGLIQSDGSFFVKIFTSPKSSKISIQPCLTISLTMRTSSTEVPKSEGSSLLLLQSIQQFLGCGFIFIDNKRNMCTFTVSDLNSL
jgi:ubiquitin C-terminal hydrolase